MTKRIFRSIFLASVSVLLAALVLVMGTLHAYFSDVQLAQLRVYLRARESTAAAALCADLARQMEAMADAHILNLMNLL